MKTWFFTEDAYPYLPDQESYESIRVNLPNRNFDPDKGADLYHMYLDMWCAADDLGLEIMNNEHHQTATCMVPAAPLMLSILAVIATKLLVDGTGAHFSNGLLIFIIGILLLNDAAQAVIDRASTTGAARMEKEGA